MFSIGASKLGLASHVGIYTTGAYVVKSGSDTYYVYPESGTFNIAGNIAVNANVYMMGGGGGGADNVESSAGSGVSANGGNASPFTSYISANIVSNKLTPTATNFTITVGAGGNNGGNGSPTSMSFTSNSTSLYDSTGGHGGDYTLTLGGYGNGTGPSGGLYYQDGGNAIVSFNSTGTSLGIGYPFSGLSYFGAGGGGAWLNHFIGEGGYYGGGRGGIINPPNSSLSTAGYINSGSGGGGRARRYQTIGGGDVFGGSGFVVVKVTSITSL